MEIKEKVLELLQVKYTLPQNIDLDQFNYIEEGYVDSLATIKFVCDLEEIFSIEFSDDEVMSDDFQIIGKLITLIEKKVH